MVASITQIEQISSHLVIVDVGLIVCSFINESIEGFEDLIIVCAKLCRVRYSAWL